MAVLWEQRKLVRELKRLEDKELALLSCDQTTKEKHVHNTYTHPQGYFIWESVLIKEILKVKKVPEDDIVAIREIQKILNTCIDDRFILQRSNEGFINQFPCPRDINVNANSSPRRIQVSEDKGKEILNFWYFWCKYIAGTFPPLTSIFITLVTALLTSGILWIYIARKIEKTLNYQNNQSHAIYEQCKQKNP